MIEFETLAMKANTDELHTIFLLKKNIQHNIIKMILGYLLIAMPETLKEWKVAITSVGQEYKSTEGCHNYKISTGTTYREQEQPMDIGKSNENFKDGKPKCFNCNKYGYIAKECRLKKKEHETRTCFKYNKIGHITRNYKGRSRNNWMIKTRKVSRILVKILSRHSIRDLPCKFPK